jgi:hypothetical protein
MNEKELANWLEKRLAKCLSIDIWQMFELETLLKKLKKD